MPKFVNRYSMSGLQPTIDGEAVLIAVTPAAGLTNVPLGAVLSQSTVVANQVHTIASNGMSAGSFNFFWRGRTSATLTKDSTLAQVQAALDAIVGGTSQVVVTGTTDVKGANLVLTWSGTFYAGLPIEPPTIVVVTTLTGATLAITNTTVGSNADRITPYVNGGANGVGTAKFLNKYQFSTDNNGQTTFGDAPNGEEFLQTRLTIPVYIAGTFMTEDIPSAGTGAMDATAAGQLGRIVKGSLTVGLLRIG